MAMSRKRGLSFIWEMDLIGGTPYSRGLGGMLWDNFWMDARDPLQETEISEIWLHREKEGWCLNGSDYSFL